MQAQQPSQQQRPRQHVYFPSDDEAEHDPRSRQQAAGSGRAKRHQADGAAAASSGGGAGGRGGAPPLLLVGNTHVLFNIKRGDVKVAQLRVLLEAMRGVADTQVCVPGTSTRVVGSGARACGRGGGGGGPPPGGRRAAGRGRGRGRPPPPPPPPRAAPPPPPPPPGGCSDQAGSEPGKGFGWPTGRHANVAHPRTWLSPCLLPAPSPPPLPPAPRRRPRWRAW